MKKICLLFTILILFVACKSASGFKVNDVVVADWYQDNWHMAKVVEVCDNGWKLKFNDNFYNAGDGKTQICYSVEKLAKNIAPSADQVKVGDLLLAEWKDDAFYTAKVQKIEGEKYSVTFIMDGWDSQLTLDKLRILPVQPLEKRLNK